MSAEKSFAVTFFKTVSDDRGWDKEIIERIVEVDAKDEASALERAKNEFCLQKGLPDWSLHADRCEVTRSASASQRR